MTPAGQLFLGLTAIVTVLVAVMTFAVLKFFTAARDTRGRMRDGGMETALLSAALQDAVTKLKAQERAMTLRAEASERLSDEIIANLTAGLLMVNRSGEVQIVNPGRPAPAQSARRPAPRRPLPAAAGARGAPGRNHRAVPQHGAHDDPPRGRVAGGHGALAAPGPQRVAARRRVVRAARRDLPLHGSLGGRGARGAGAAQGQPGEGR